MGSNAVSDSDIQFTDATADDVAQITAIYNQYATSSIITLQEGESSMNAIASKLEGFRSGGMQHLVAKDINTGAVCGYVYADDWAERAGYRFSAESSVYLHPDNCGRGLGRQLLQANIDKLRECGRKQVLTKVSMMPEQAVEDVQSCRLHMSLGFELVGRLRKVGFKLGKWIDVTILQLSLADDAT